MDQSHTPRKWNDRWYWFDFYLRHAFPFVVRLTWRWNKYSDLPVITLNPEGDSIACRFQKVGSEDDFTKNILDFLKPSPFDAAVLVYHLEYPGPPRVFIIQDLLNLDFDPSQHELRIQWATHGKGELDLDTTQKLEKIVTEYHSDWFDRVIFPTANFYNQPPQEISTEFLNNLDKDSQHRGLKILKGLANYDIGMSGKITKWVVCRIKKQQPLLPYEQIYFDGYSETWERKGNNPNVAFLVFNNDGQEIGYLIGLLCRNFSNRKKERAARDNLGWLEDETLFFVNHIFILSERQRKGIGTIFLSYLLDILRDQFPLRLAVEVVDEAQEYWDGVWGTTPLPSCHGVYRSRRFESFLLSNQLPLASSSQSS